MKYVTAMLCGLVVAWLGMAQVYSQPAPWYWWVSQRDGHKVCAQVMPKQGWTRGAGPFDNAQCKPQRKSLLSVR